MFKKIVSVLTCCFSLMLVCSFEYPQPISDSNVSDDIAMYFGDSMKDAYSPALVFSKSDTVTSTAAGKVLIRMAKDPQFGFPSTLGNTLIVKHDNDIVCAYGNLKEISLTNRAKTLRNVQTIGESGSSAWQIDESGVILITYDIKNRTVFNPLIILPRLETPRLPPVYSLSLIDSRGTEYDLDTRRTVPSGTYYLYRSRSTAATITHKSTVLINGQEATSVDYNMLSQKKDVLSAFSTKHFPFSIAYPSNDKQLLGSVLLHPGRNVITITLTDIAENIRTATQVVEAY